MIMYNIKPQTLVIIFVVIIVVVTIVIWYSALCVNPDDYKEE